MAVMKSKMSKTKRAAPVKSKQRKMIKPPVPSKAVKPRPGPTTIHSKTGALGATSPY